MNDTLEERYRQWVEEEGPRIDREGLLGEEIKSLTPGNNRGVPTLSGAEVREATDFPVRGGASARIDETMHKLAFKRAPKGKNVNALPTGKQWQKPRERIPAPWGKGQPKGGRWSHGKRVLTDTAGPGLEAPVTAAAVSAETTLI